MKQKMKINRQTNIIVLTLCGMLLRLLGVSSGWAQTEIEGEVSGEWNVEGSPYIVLDSTWVPEDETLRITEGVTVLFDESLGLDIFGEIKIEGTEEDSVFLLPRNDDSPWRGIYMWGNEDNRPGNEFIYCTLRGANNGLLVYQYTNLSIIHSDINCHEKSLGGIPELAYSNRYHTIYIENSIGAIHYTNVTTTCSGVEVFT